MNATRKQLLVSGIIQLIIGSLCLIFGIAERVLTDRFYTITTEYCYAIWMGLWIAITGILGILTKVKSSFKPMTAFYMGFSIISIIFASVMLICYPISMVFYPYYILNYGGSYSIYRSHNRKRSEYIVMSILIVASSVLEFGIGIWASVCCGWDLCCNRCCEKSQTGTAGQVFYMQTQGGGPPAAYVIIQGPDGIPLAVPFQTSGPMMEESGIPPHYSGAAGQVVYLQTQGGGPSIAHVQGPDGKPVAVPAQTSGPKPVDP